MQSPPRSPEGSAPQRPGPERPEPVQAAVAPPTADEQDWAFRADRSGTDDEVAADSLLVRIGAGRYLLPMGAVREVGRVPELTRLPGTPHWVAGAGNWRGRVLGVVDLTGLLGEVPAVGLPGRRSTRRLVVVRHEEATVGLLVDEVQGVRELAHLPVEPVPSTTPLGVRELLLGQVVPESGPVALVDLGGLMALRDQLPRPRALVAT